LKAIDRWSELVQWLADASNVVVLTGAGMSAESGIPTFRDVQNGLWSQYDPHALATPGAYRVDKALVWGWYIWRMAKVRAAQPHDGHVALAQLAALKPGLVVVTQNVDDLHERAGNRSVVHLHGSLFASRCYACGRPAGTVELTDDIADRPLLRRLPPRCAHCGGYVRPGVVWFGESLPKDAWNMAEARVSQCDLLLVVGTSGVVYPAASLPSKARACGAKVVEINPVATDLSDKVDWSWRTTAQEGLPRLVSCLARGDGTGTCRV
jgi:NAD-dependent deacetylase